MNTDRRAGAEPIMCVECGDHFEGSRTNARRAFWEPWSTATQQLLDHGPMVCPACVDRILDRLLDALRNHARELHSVGSLPSSEPSA